MDYNFITIKKDLIKEKNRKAIITVFFCPILYMSEAFEGLYFTKCFTVRFICSCYLFTPKSRIKKGMMSVQQSPAAVTSSGGGRKIKTKKTADKIKGIITYLL